MLEGQCFGLQRKLDGALFRGGAHKTPHAEIAQAGVLPLRELRDGFKPWQNLQGKCMHSKGSGNYTHWGSYQILKYFMKTNCRDLSMNHHRVGIVQHE